METKQRAFGQRAVTLTLLDGGAADSGQGGVVTVVEERYMPPPGDIAAEEGREVAWRLGLEPTTRAIARNVTAVAAETTLSAQDRARERGIAVAFTEALLMAAGSSLALSDDEPEVTDMGELWHLDQTPARSSRDGVGR